MNEKDALLKVTSKILGKKSDELAELIYQKSEDGKELTFKTDAVDILLGLNADKIKSIKEDNKQGITDAHDNGYKKAQKEIMTELEKEFKTKTEFKSDSKGLDLFVGYAESVKGSTKTEPTIDQVKQHPVFLEREKELVELHKKNYGELETNFNDFKNGIDRTSSYNSKKSEGWNKILAMKPVIEEGVVGENRKAGCLSEFEKYTYKDDIILLDDKRVEDSQGNPLTVDQLTEQIAKNHFTFAKQDDKGSAGNNGDGSGDSGEFVITSKEHFIELAEKYNGNPEMGAKVSAAWTVYKAKQ